MNNIRVSEEFTTYQYFVNFIDAISVKVIIHFNSIFSFIELQYPLELTCIFPTNVCVSKRLMCKKRKSNSDSEIIYLDKNFNTNNNEIEKIF